MASILITGATGNIGMEVIRSLFKQNTNDQIYAGVRDIEKAQSKFYKYPKLNYKVFDFEDVTTFPKALANIDTVFLLRPPQIADTKKYIQPLFEEMRDKEISNIVFLSVQGAEKNKHIPHYNIEKLIEQFQFQSIFIRPSYFMQNLSTTLYDEIKQNKRIYIPAKNLKLNWIDAQDIGLASATALLNFETHKNHVFEITGNSNHNFKEVSQIISKVTSTKIDYVSPNLLRFARNQWHKNKPWMMILVMIMLHYLPALQKVKPKSTHDFERLTGQNPTTLEDFIEREKALFA